MNPKLPAFTAGLLGALVLALALAPGVSAAQTPPDPQQLPPTGVPWRDQIYYGATPPGSESLPVMIFVHGFGGAATDWWRNTKFHGTNDMYASAYNAGYRTAFVTLNPDGERVPIRSMWINGFILSRQIAAVANHYGVSQVDIVAHSKGGVDAQTAVAYFGAAPLVRNIFTLSSPNWGSELADLSETTIGQFLLRLLGLDDVGIQYVTTSYMQAYRALTDARAQDDGVNYYWAGGTDWGPQSSPLWFSGRYLNNNFGPNDGLVTVASAEMPGDNSTQLFVEPFNHDNIHMGSTSFPYIDAIASQPVAAAIATPLLE